MSTISLRTDPEIDAALTQLGATSGSRTQIIKDAILALAEFRLRDQERREAERLGADAADRAENAAVQTDMDGLRAW